MQHLDQQVVEQALNWLVEEQETVWLCTVLSTFGSSPREPGALMAARADGAHIGSLSGGCVEEDFLERLSEGAFNHPLQTQTYGSNPPGDQTHRPQVTLPCGGTLEVLIERLTPSDQSREHLQRLLDSLSGQSPLLKTVNLNSGEVTFHQVNSGAGPRVIQQGEKIQLRIGPSVRLVIAGLSSVARQCAQFAVALGYEVIVCEPREEEYQGFDLPGVRLETRMPSAWISKPDNIHPQTAIVAMTHDPRIDDLAMIEAVKTSAFYIGVMGSRRTSDKRAERLMRVGGLNAEQIERLHMPIGLALGSKTPAEIALAIMADIMRCQRGVARDQL